MNKSVLIIALSVLVANAEWLNVIKDPQNLCPEKQVNTDNLGVVCADGKVIVEPSKGEGLLGSGNNCIGIGCKKELKQVKYTKPTRKRVHDWVFRVGWVIDNGDTILTYDLTTEAQKLQQRFNESNEVECTIPEPEIGKVPPLKSWKPCNKYAESDPYPRSKCLKDEAYFQAREKWAIACSDGLDPMSKSDVEKEFKRVLGNKPRKLK